MKSSRYLPNTWSVKGNSLLQFVFAHITALLEVSTICGFVLLLSLLPLSAQDLIQPTTFTWSAEGFAPDNYLIVPEASAYTNSYTESQDSFILPATQEDACSSSPSTRLNRGKIAYASLPAQGETSFALRVRAQPGGRQIGFLNPGTLFEILSGPECDDEGLRWWRIQTMDGRIDGWSVEAIAPDNYLITPVELQKREPLTTQNAHLMVPLGSVGWGEMEDPANPSVAHDIAISPDGSLLAVAENSITLWDTHSGDFVASLPYLTSSFNNSMTFNPDGQLLAFTHNDHIIIVNISDGAQMQTFKGIEPFTWSTDGRYLIYTTAIRETIIFRDIATEEDVAFIQIEKDASISDIAVSPNGTQLAVAVNDVQVSRDQTGNLICHPGKIYFWSVMSVLSQQQNVIGKEDTSWEIGECATGRIAFRPDGQVLAVTQYTGQSVELSEEVMLGSWNIVQMWDVESGQKQGELAGEEAPVFSWHSDIMATLTQRDFRAFRLWNAKLGGEIQNFGSAHYNGHAPFPNEIIFSPDGTLMVVMWNGYFPFSSVELWGVPIIE